MNGYKNLGLIIDNVQEYEVYINELDKLPVITQKYFTPLIIPDYPCWLEYANERKLLGSVSITSGLYKNSNLLTFVEKIFKDLSNSQLGKYYTFKKTKINIVKTIGDVGVHQDTGARSSCINLGLYNSSKGITKISTNLNLENFENTAESFTVKEGYAYLLNTSCWHSVKNTTEDKRYLITYSFSQPYDKLMEIFENVL